MRQLLGRRGGALLLSGILWLLVAWSVDTMPVPVGRVLAPHEYFPPVVRVLGWAITGSFAVISAFLWRRSPRKDGTHQLDRYAFAGLMLMPAERALSWLTVLVLQISGWHPLPLPSYGSALAGFSVWVVVCLHTFLISGWAEPEPCIEFPEVG